MEKQFNYVYITTNLVNGKQYVGDHSTNNLNDSYLGGGRLFKLKMNEYGKENFKKEILEFFNSKEDAFNAQEKYIIQYNTLVPNGYNISPKGGHDVLGSVSELTKQKISKKQKGRKLTEEHKQKLKGPKSNEHKQSLKENHADISGEKNPMYGKKHSKETKQKLSAKASLRTGSKNSFFGKHHSKETIDKINNTKIKNGTKSKYKIYCFNNDKLYLSLNDVERELKISSKDVSLCCKKIMSDIDGFKFKFV